MSPAPSPQRPQVLTPPAPGALAAAPPGRPPALLVVIDTEEEFDWSGPFDRARTSVGHMRVIDRVQDLFDELGARPTYVVDYPIASQPDGYEPLREIVASGRGEVGAHLHPWVSPPHEEEVTTFHSYPGNLPPELERRKLQVLVAAIEEHVGVRPTTYKAGRYGLGAHTPATLAALGFTADLSPCPPFDFTGDGGPDWSAFPVDPFWHDAERRVLAIPTTGGYVGFVRGGAHRLYSLATGTALAKLRAGGILSRLGAVERLMLSPEGYEPAHHERLARTLLARGCTTLTFSFHSPSVVPGCTPYVSSEADLARFLDVCRTTLELLLGELGLVPRTARELRDELAGA